MSNSFKIRCETGGRGRLDLEAQALAGPTWMSASTALTRLTHLLHHAYLQRRWRRTRRRRHVFTVGRGTWMMEVLAEETRADVDDSVKT